MGTAAAQITTASKAVQTLQGGRLAGFVPEAPAGWQREIDSSSTESMAMLGLAGNLIEASY